MSLQYVEDFIEVIAGIRDPVTGNRITTYLFTVTPIINLARYDVNVIESMAEQCLTNQPFTQRQADLACRIILKYTRQLATKCVDVSPVENPKWRTAIRIMDYSRRVYIENDVIILRFPYNANTIEHIRDFTKTSQGSATWSRTNKQWEFALTEYNLSWIIAWCTANEFEIDPAITILFDKLTEVESSDYAIELCITDSGQLTIRNAADSLLNYVNVHLGGLEFSNLMRLVDMSAILGYTVHADIANALTTEYGARFYNLISNREVKINPGTLMSADDFASVLDYADKMERWPVVVYEPDLTGKMLERLLELRPNQVFQSKRKYEITDPAPSDRYIYTSAPLRKMEIVPLVISSAGMMFGGDKQLMIQRAGKVVYCAVDVYNKRTKSKVTDIAS